MPVLSPPSPPSPPRLLILGGTGEAAALAREAVARFGDRLRVTSSLAGRTKQPSTLAGDQIGRAHVRTPVPS